MCFAKTKFALEKNTLKTFRKVGSLKFLHKPRCKGTLEGRIGYSE